MWISTSTKLFTRPLGTGLTAAVLTIGVALTGCTRAVSFRSDIQPILKSHCIECHSEGGIGFKKSGFRADSYASVMQGTKYGPVVEPGSSISSTLYRLVAGKTDPAIRMPYHRNPLPEETVELIATWINQGAKNN
ncbi:MAG: c-type cytochrome domain-containing protein [Burkholderiales bacterium]